MAESSREASYREMSADSDREHEAAEWIEGLIEDSLAVAILFRGEVWRVHLGPSLGGEMQKTRPAVIVCITTSNHREPIAGGSHHEPH